MRQDRRTLVRLSIALTIAGWSLCCVQAYGQVTRQWTQRYNGVMNGADAANALAVDDQGYIYVTGISHENNSRGHITTIKYDAAGNQVWIDKYTVSTGDGRNKGIDIAVQPSSLGGNVFVTGEVSTAATLGDDQDIITIKYTPSGVRQWIRTYSYLEEWGIDGGVEVATDRVGNVVVVGYITGNGTLDDIATVKYDPAGTELWVQTYTGASATDVPRGIAVDDSSNAYVISSSFSFWGSATHDFTTIRYTPTGVEEWLVIYNGSGDATDQPTDIAVDNLQNTYVTGYVVGSNGTLDFATIKQNNFGTRLWVATYNGSANGTDSAVAIGNDVAGNVYVTGRSLELRNSIPVEAITTIKYTPTGSLAWRRSFLGPTNDGAVPSALAVDAAGNAYVTGYSGSIQNSSRDIVVIKYDSSGNQQWIDFYNGSGNGVDMATGITVSVSGNIYVSGKSIGQGTSFDYVTIRYSQTTNVVPDASTLPQKLELFQNYPNPFNPTTAIRFEIPQSGFVSLKVFDVLGREVATLVNEEKSAGKYAAQWDATGYGSGTYFVGLESDGKRATKKIMLLK